MMEQQERGWYAASRTHVCDECFNENAIRDFVAANAVSQTCEYCGRVENRPIAASADDVLELIHESITFEWGDALDEGLPWESREGGWQLGPTYDTWDLLDLLDWPVLGDEFRHEVLQSLQDHMWCQKDFYELRREDALGYGWSEFVEKVKHHSRFVFMAPPYADGEYREVEEIPAGRMLAEIGRCLDEAGLLGVMPVGTCFFRARVHEQGIAVTDAAELGSPPRERATWSNRMSPAGIPMFYGATNESTAVAETFDPAIDAGKIVTTGRFALARELWVVDLASLSEIPSLFSREDRYGRSVLMFLHGFASDLSKRIDRDGREHVEYVPTQVVTEYIRRVHKTPAGDPVDGILYRSSRVPAETCLVLFVENSECADMDAIGLDPPPTLVLQGQHRLSELELAAIVNDVK